MLMAPPALNEIDRLEFDTQLPDSQPAVALEDSQQLENFLKPVVNLDQDSLWPAWTATTTKHAKHRAACRCKEDE